jgi:RHS repeat-associated protein
MQLGGGVYGYADHYDLLKRRVSTLITRTSDGATAYYQTRTFDATNDLTAETTDLQGLSDNQAFCYDDQSRLTWASAASGSIPCGGSNSAGTNTGAVYTQPFTYDTLGRLTTGPLGSYTYGSGAHLHAATAVGGAWTGAYDAAGNLTCRAPTSAVTCTGTPATGQALTYDAEGRLAAWQNAQSSPTSTASYLYDGEGNRVEAVTSAGGVSTSTVYLGNTEEVATTGGTTTTTTYYYAGSLRIALAVNGVISYLATDLLGSSSVALNSTGTTTAAQLYAPYGGVRYASGTIPTDYGFTGQKSDAASTGLDYYVSRYYDPVVGQFVSPDSTLSQNGYNPWGLSRYAYVQGNPETLADPDGHCWPLCTMIVGALIGAAVGAGISIVTQVASGQSINWGEVGTQAAVGAVSGAIAGLAGPEAGPLGGLAAHALIGAASGAAGQLVNNAMTGKPLGDGVLMAGLIGGATVGLGEGVGGPLLSKLLGKAAGEAAGVAEDAARGVSREAGAEVEDAAGADMASACPLSFAPGTPVATPKGEKPIASLKVGDQVVAYDPKTGKTSTQTVEHVWIHHDTDLIDLTLRTEDGAHARPPEDLRKRRAALVGEVYGRAPAAVGRLATATSPGRDEVVHTTAKHPFLTAGSGWVPAGALTAEMHVVREDGGPATVVGVRVVPGAAAMWNLTVSQVHTYAVGGGQYVVHNCGGGRPLTVKEASRALDAGDRAVTVASKGDAEELFLSKYAGEGYKNSTGLDKDLAGGMTDQGAKDFFGDDGFYHWDDQWDPDNPGRLLGHGPENPHGNVPHLQIHPPDAKTIRIFFGS